MNGPRFWMNLNGQSRVTFDYPLNPGFVFWIRRKFGAKVDSQGGERVTVTRRQPFTEDELNQLYWETEYRQRVVSYRGAKLSIIPKGILKGRLTFVEGAELGRKL